MKDISQSSKKAIAITAAILFATASPQYTCAKMNNSQEMNSSIKKAIAEIPSKPPKRNIVAAHNLHWGSTGAFTSSQRIKPELYGSFFRGKMYSWLKGTGGTLIANINEIRSLADVTMISWGAKIPGRPLVNQSNITTAEAVTGCGYYSSKLSGWETGTIFNYKNINKMQFAHVWHISSDGDLLLWETLCPTDWTIGKCQTELEKEIPAHTKGQLKIGFITAEPLHQGIQRFIEPPNWYQEAIKPEK